MNIETCGLDLSMVDFDEALRQARTALEILDVERTLTWEQLNTPVSDFTYEGLKTWLRNNKD